MPHPSLSKNQFTAATTSALPSAKADPELMTSENTMIKIAPGKRLRPPRETLHARDSALRRLSRHQNLCTPREYPRGYLDQPIGTDRAPS